MHVKFNTRIRRCLNGYSIQLKNLVIRLITLISGIKREQRRCTAWVVTLSLLTNRILTLTALFSLNLCKHQLRRNTYTSKCVQANNLYTYQFHRKKVTMCKTSRASLLLSTTRISTSFHQKSLARSLSSERGDSCRIKKASLILSQGA